MKQKLLFFKTFLLIAIMTMFGTNSWAAEVTLSAGTHDGSSITWTLNDGSTTAVTIKQLKGAGTAVSSNYISAPRVYRANLLSFEAASGYAITNISISYTSTYKGTTITSGTSMNGNDVISNTTDINQTLSTASNGTHTFASTSSAGLPAIYIQNGTTSATNTQLRITKIDVTFVTTGGGSLDPSDLALTGDPVALNFDLYNNSSAQTVNYTTSSTGAVSVSGGTGYVTTSVSGSTITVTPVAVTPSAQTITVSQEADATYEAGSVTFTVNVTDSTPLPTYTVTLGDNGATLTESTGGAGVTLPSRSDVGNYTFAGWTTSEITTETTTAPTIIPAGSYQPTANITLYPVYTRTESGGGTSSQTANVNISEYATANGWGSTSSASQKTINIDSNVTATCNDGTNSGKYYKPAWRIYQGEGGAITIATAQGTLTSVTFTFTVYNTGTLNYGSTVVSSETPVSVSGTSAEFTVGNSGTATNGQVRITAISVDYEVASSTTYYTSVPSGQVKVATPTITIASGPFVSTKAVTIACTETGATIQYSTDGGTTWTNYSAPFDISATTTVQAKATKTGMADSDVATQTFTKETVLQGISALTALTNTTAANFYVDLTDAQVTWASSSIGYMEDSNAGIYLYNVSPTQNLVYNGIFQVSYQYYNNMPEIKSITDVEGSTAAGTAKAATVMTAAQLDANFTANLGRQIQINSFTVPSSNQLTTDIALYGSSPYTSVTAEKTYTLVGYPYINNTTKTFRIVSATEQQLQDNAINGIDASYTLDLAAGDNEVDLSGATATSGATVQFTVQSSTIAAADYDFTDGVLTVSSNGTMTIRAYVEAGNGYNGAEKIVSVTVKADPVIACAGATETTMYGTPYTVDASLIEGGEASLVSSIPAIATVSGMTITPVAAGTVTITINTAAAEIWNAGTATFTLTVTAPAGKTTAAQATTTIFNEQFSGCDGTGGNDGSWSGSIANKTLTDGTNTDETGWTFTKGNSADECAKFGTGSAKGSATTRALGAEGTLTLTFKAGAWDGSSEGTTLNLSVSNGSIDTESVTLVKGEFNEYTATITNATAETTITFEAQNTSNNRFFLDDIVVTTEGAAAITATFNASGYTTYCSQYPLDFTHAETNGYSAWQITDIDGSNNITFEKVTGTVKGGTGLFLMGTATETVELTSVNSTYELYYNILVGTTAPTYFAAGQIYGLAGDTFKKNNAGAIRANKAYIPASYITATGGTKAFTFNFVDNTTGITETRTVSAEDAAAIFNIAGQRLSQPQKGVNIINGKKVLVK